MCCPFDKNVWKVENVDHYSVALWIYQILL